MSLTKRTTRRLSLMAGSSLVAAGVSALVSAGAALAPTAAFAQVATCVAGVAPLGAGPAVVIPAGTHNPGITCAYVGDGATVSTDGAITVSSSGGVPADPLVNGVNLSATGTSDIIWNSTAGTVTGSSQTNGPVIEALTEQGDITLNVASVFGFSATVTDGVRAISSGGGNVAITVLNPAGTATIAATNSTTGDAAIEAVSTGGNGDVSVTLGNASFFGNASGRLYGIQAQASGSGDLTVDLVRGSISNNATAGVAAVDLTTGTGALTLSATSSFLGSTNNLGHALRLNTGGDANIMVGGLNGRGLDNAVLDMTTSSGTLTTVTSSGRIGIGAITSTLEPFLTRAIEGRGGGDIQINTRDLRGVVDFSALTGDASLAVSNTWEVQSMNRFGSGDDTVSIGAGGALTLYSTDRTPSPVSTIIFGGGADTFNNAGVIVFDGFGVGEDITFSLEGLEAFNNSGLIRLGNTSNQIPANTLSTDGDPDDVLMMPGATFIGSGDSLVLMDVSYSSPNQTACDPALRDADTGEMPAADCIGIQGGATAGVTKLLVFDRVPGDRGFNNSIVLVDVAGGTSEAGHFVLDERSDSYSPDNGGVIDKNLLTYALVYDADLQQHMLLSTPGANALQFALLPSVAHSLWRTTTGTWFDRQADLRVGDLPEIGGGVWMRLSGEAADRDVNQTVETASATLEYDGSFEQTSYAVTGGIDLIAGAGASTAYVVGLMAGYANAQVEYGATENTASYDGFSGGAYASLLSGGLFVDALVNANRLVLKEDIPSLNLFPEGTILDTNLVSVGGQVEAGWRFPVMGNGFIEPLASASYVRVKYDDELEIPSDDSARPRIGVDYDDPTSLRAGLGGRIGLEQDYGPVRAQLSLMAKAWNEFEGENTAALTSVAGDTLMVDDFSGQFNEFAVGASIWSPGGIVSGFASFGGKWGDDYKSQNIAAGVRVNW